MNWIGGGGGVLGAEAHVWYDFFFFTVRLDEISTVTPTHPLKPRSTA